MAVNNFLNTNWVAMEVLRLLVNKLIVAEYFNTSWKKEFDKEFAVGSTVSIKFPQLFKVANGQGYQPQGINRRSTTVSLDQWLQCSWEWDDYETAVKLERSEEELREQYWDPAAAALAQECDNRAADWARTNTSMVAGALGTDPTSVSTYYTARQYLEENAAGELGKRCQIVSSSMMTSIGSNITNIFNPGSEISRAWKMGKYMGMLGGADWYESQSLYSHTAGTWAGAVTVSGAAQSGTSLVISATAGDTFNVGDKFSIANVNLVNPMTYRVPGKARNKTFTITQALTAIGGAGADTISFLPAIFGPGSQYQNVDALPANGAALTLWPGTTSPNGKVGTVGLQLTKQAFAMVGAKLYSPKAVERVGFKQDPDTGLGVRIVIAWDPVRSMRINRMDSLLGFGNLYQDNGAVAVVGA